MKLWTRLFGPRGVDRETVAGRKRETTAELDRALVIAREGMVHDDATLDRCGATFGRLYDALSAFHGTGANTDFSPDDRLYFYVEAVKLAAIGHRDHNGWPVMSELRGFLFDAFRERLEHAWDPWHALCAIQPALLAGKVDFALECYRRIEGDPFLTDLARRWADDSTIAFTAYNHVAAANAFLAALPPRLDAWNADGVHLTPARRAALLATIYPSYAVDPRTSLAPRGNPAVQRGQLSADWGIDGHGSARGMLDWLLHEGHGAELRRDLADPSKARSPERRRFVQMNADALRRHGIRAWDLCRLIATARASYAAGYLDEAEAWERILEAAEALRAEYASWDALGDDYALGCGYFDPGGGGGTHVSTVRWLKDDPRSPWKRFSFEPG